MKKNRREIYEAIVNAKAFVAEMHESDEFADFLKSSEFIAVVADAYIFWANKLAQLSKMSYLQTVAVQTVLEVGSWTEDGQFFMPATAFCMENFHIVSKDYGKARMSFVVWEEEDGEDRTYLLSTKKYEFIVKYW